VLLSPCKLVIRALLTSSTLRFHRLVRNIKEGSHVLFCSLSVDSC